MRFITCWVPRTLLVLGLTGCQTMGRIKAIDLSEPGWGVRQGQAVWQMPGKRPELAGDLLLAINSDGRCFLEFSKMPLPMVRANCTEKRWEIEFPPRKLFFAGGGLPPKRFAWLHVCYGLTGKPVRAPWRFERREDGTWRLDNTRSKEAMEGYLQP